MTSNAPNGMNMKNNIFTRDMMALMKRKRMMMRKELNVGNTVTK
jgi:hypothetical protein